MINTDPKAIDEILNRGTIVDILPTKEEFRNRLLSGERLRFYIGFDATAPTLHLSHAKNFILMEKLRKLGHEVIILFGDFTARIGDPSGEKSARKQLTRDEVMRNVKRWKELVRPLMDFSNKENPPKIMYNHDWLSKLTFEDVIGLASNFTVQQMLERDMFERRIKAEKPIHLHEFFYPLMQGYDSVAMEVDGEVCGTDQIFNALAGRTLLKKLKGKDKFVIAVTLMENPKTGELMSKSKGTGAFLDVSANDMYGQIMAQPDEMIEVLFVNLTDLTSEEIKNLDILGDPKSAKMRLAYEIVKMLNNEDSAKAAQDDFSTKFSKRETPDDLPLTSIDYEDEPIFKLLSKISPETVGSNTIARQLIEQGAVDIDGDLVEDPYFKLEKDKEYVLKIGKKVFKKVIFN